MTTYTFDYTTLRETPFDAHKLSERGKYQWWAIYCCDCSAVVPIEVPVSDEDLQDRPWTVWNREDLEPEDLLNLELFAWYMGAESDTCSHV